MAAVAVCITSCRFFYDPIIFVEIGGNYPPVTAEQLLRSKFSHRTGATRFDFNWTFTVDSFIIEGDGIPHDLIISMWGEDKPIVRIEGTWQISNSSIDFVLPSRDTQAEPRKCSLPIFSTGVIRIATPESQYVFGPSGLSVGPGLDHHSKRR